MYIFQYISVILMVMLKGEGKKNARSPLMGHAPKVPAAARPGGAKRALSKTVRN